MDESQSARSVTSDQGIAPHKARRLVIVGAVLLLHAVLLLVFWPHRWRASYKWLLLPDSVSAYFVLALGIEHLKIKRSNERKSS